MPKKLTSDEFFSRARIVHNGKYSYHDDFINTRSRILITCQIHGNFTQEAKKHLQGHGCPRCGKELARGLNKGKYEDFLTSFRKKFNDRFSIPKIKNEYENSRSDLTVICNRCGFTRYLCGNYILSDKCSCDCQECNYKLDYGAILAYNKTPYTIKKFDGLKDSRIDKVTMVCDKHGEYEANVKSIIVGNGNCKKCNGFKRRLSHNDFVKRLNDKYGNSVIPLTRYKGWNDDMEFICKYGHTFKRTPNNFFSNDLLDVCPICSKSKIASSRRKTTEDFINDAINIHGKKRYDFSATSYKSSSSHVIIKCNECGKNFSIEANSFLQGHGCPNHNKKSSLEEEVENVLIENSIEYEKQKRFDWMGQKSLDFYIPSKKIAIECQGRQHFKPIEYFGGLESFKKQFARDIEKRKECEAHGIAILYYATDPSGETSYEIINDKSLLIEKIINNQNKSKLIKGDK